MRTERANAKINAYLNVLSRRENGYHNILSIMQTVSLCDLVTVNYDPNAHTSIVLEASGNDHMPTDCRNLAYRAAERLMQATGRRGRVEIRIQKRIPMAAGLAGGSADAAAVLRALNALMGSPKTQEELCTIGATLGADVPFCIVGGSARVTGIGDQMEMISPMPDGFLVVACRGEGVSTPQAYGDLDRKYDHFTSISAPDGHCAAIEEAWKEGDLLRSAEHFFNLFEEVVPQVQKDVDVLKAIMYENGAVRAMMSGSGPSVFGVFKDLEDADQACKVLLENGADAFVCHPIER